MDWLNLHTSILDSEEVIGAEPIERATWLMLLRYCIGQENGGVIRGARQWKDRKWQQIVRITQAETQAKTQLWTWQGDDLHVTHYPIEKERIVKGGRVGGAAKTQAKTQASRMNGRQGGRPKNPTDTQGKTQAPTQGKTQAPTQGKTQQKGREIEGNGIPPFSPPTGGPSEAGDVVNVVALYPKRERQQEAIEALAQHVRKGTDLEEVANGTRAIAAVIAQLPGGHLNAYVPSAATFFRNRRWSDDPATWLRNARTGRTANGAPMPELDLGGRKPAAVIEV